jgi:hypothetical protein
MLEGKRPHFNGENSFLKPPTIEPGDCYFASLEERVPSVSGTEGTTKRISVALSVHRGKIMCVKRLSKTES